MRTACNKTSYNVHHGAFPTVLSSTKSTDYHAVGAECYAGAPEPCSAAASSPNDSVRNYAAALKPALPALKPAFLPCATRSMRTISTQRATTITTTRC